jgi:hypothetical protein
LSNAAVWILLFLLSPIAAPQRPGNVGTVSGRITAAAGLPAVGVRVAAMPVQGDIQGVSASGTLSNLSQTDGEGRYRLENVQPGRYLIVAGALTSPTYYPGSVTPEEARIVTIAPGQALIDMDFLLGASSQMPVTPGGANQPQIRGTVRVDDGTPLPFSPMPMRVRLTNQVGIVQPDGLILLSPTPGTNQPIAANIPMGYYVKAMTSGNVDLLKNPLVVPSAAVTIPLDIVLTKTPPPGAPPVARLSGRLTGQSFPLNSDLAMTLMVVAGTPGLLRNTRAVAFVIVSKTDGAFEMRGVPPGRYMLESRILDVAGKDISNIELRLGRTVEGTVNVTEGAVPQFEITLTPTKGGASAETVTVSDKEFRISVAPGEYRASISALPPGYAVESVRAGPLDLTEPFQITYSGIADRFSGVPVLIQPDVNAPAVNAVIAIKLRALSPEGK